MTTAQIQYEALQRAEQGQSTANYVPIFEGFAAKGIPMEDVQPRENVFTFWAWKAKGRSVRKGEHGVKVTTWIPLPDKRDKATGEVVRKGGKRCKTTTVFHISQTDPIGEGVAMTAPEPTGDYPAAAPVASVPFKCED